MRRKWKKLRETACIFGLKLFSLKYTMKRGYRYLRRLLKNIVIIIVIICNLVITLCRIPRLFVIYNMHVICNFIDINIINTTNILLRELVCSD